MRWNAERLLYRFILGTLMVLALITTVCQLLYNYYPATVRRTIVALSPPIGFNKPVLASGPIALDQIGWHKEWLVRHKYKARHDACLVWKQPTQAGQTTPAGQAATDNADPLWIKPGSSLMLRVDFFLGDRLAKSYTVSSLDFSFSHGDGATGCHMLDYDVPTDLPVGAEVRCAVTVLQADPEWQARFGSAEFILGTKGQA